MASQIERILILAKTYPSPSAQHVETSCVAGINEHGAMRRLYPMPFRLIEEGQKFKKWQWIDGRIEKANKDHRTESHKLYVDTITCGDVIDTKKQWDARWPWIEKLPTFTSFDDLEANRIETGLSLALMRPKQVLTLDIVEAKNAEWTDEEREKLLRCAMQGQLFSDTEVKKMTQALRKVPFGFYYRYTCDTPEGEKVLKSWVKSWPCMERSQVRARRRGVIFRSAIISYTVQMLVIIHSSPRGVIDRLVKGVVNPSMSGATPANGC